MKVLYILGLCLLAFFTASAQLPSIDYTKIEGIPSSGTSSYTDLGLQVRHTNDAFFVSGITLGRIDSVNTGTLAIKPDTPSIKTFVFKYNHFGNKLFGFTIPNTNANKIVPTSDGGCYVIMEATITGAIDLNPLPSANLLLAVTPYSRIVAKYNAQGLPNWAFTIKDNTPTNQILFGSQSCEIDNADNLYLHGSFADSISLDPSNPAFHLYAPGMRSGFLAKYTGTGQLAWAFKLQSSNQNYNSSYYRYRNSMDINIKNEIAIYDVMENSFDADPSTATTLLDTANGYHFVARYNTNGNLLNAFNFGDIIKEGVNFPAPYGYGWIESDSASNIYIGSRALGGDIDPGSGQFYFATNNYKRDFALASYTKNGQLRWAQQLKLLNTINGGSTDNDARGSVNDDGNLFIIHHMDGPVDFDPGNFTAIHKPTTAFANVNGYNLHNVIAKYNTKGYYSGSFDPVDTSNFALSYSMFDIDVDNDCNVYTTGGYYTHTQIPATSTLVLQSAAGPITYPLNNINHYEAVTVKYSDDFPINPIIQNDSSQLKICAGDSLTVNVSGTGTLNWYTAAAGGNLVFSGISNSLPTLYADTVFYVEEVSCNAISGRTKVEIFVTPLNNAVSLSSDTLRAYQNNATYQWIDCITNLPLPNDTNQFISGKYGTFAVDITTSGCTRRSPCINLWPNAVQDFDADDKIKIYPNPGQKNITVEILGHQKSLRYNLLTPTGNNILSGETLESKTSIDISAVAKGIYFLQVENFGTYKIIKE